MGQADHLVLGDYNVVCYECGFKRKASKMVKNWQGYWLCPEHNEPRQTQDFVRPIPDNQNVPWVQPAPGVTYTYVDEVIGYGNGVQTVFQLGSGIYPTSVTDVKGGFFPHAGTPLPYTADAKGLITLTTPAANRLMITASGTEIVR